MVVFRQYTPFYFQPIRKDKISWKRSYTLKAGNVMFKLLFWGPLRSRILNANVQSSLLNCNVLIKATIAKVDVARGLRPHKSNLSVFKIVNERSSNIATRVVREDQLRIEWSEPRYTTQEQMSNRLFHSDFKNYPSRELSRTPEIRLTFTYSIKIFSTVLQNRKWVLDTTKSKENT